MTISRSWEGRGARGKRDNAKRLRTRAFQVYFPASDRKGAPPPRGCHSQRRRRLSFAIFRCRAQGKIFINSAGRPHCIDLAGLFSPPRVIRHPRRREPRFDRFTGNCGRKSPSFVIGAIKALYFATSLQLVGFCLDFCASPRPRLKKLDSAASKRIDGLGAGVGRGNRAALIPGSLISGKKSRQRRGVREGGAIKTRAAYNSRCVARRRSEYARVGCGRGGGGVGRTEIPP